MDGRLDWRDLPELAGVDLEDSWVLGWRHDPAAGRMTIRLDASLWPGHPAYAAPAPGEHTCYRPAELTFEGVRSVAGLREQADVPGHRDPDGSQDYGSIDGLDRTGEAFRLAGEMGDVTFTAAALRLDLVGTGEPGG